MSPYEFTNVLVAVDGSEDARKALDCALSVCSALGARLTALAVEGILPAYAASLGEIEEVKREQDELFTRVLGDAEQAARERGVELRKELAFGHAAEVITHYAAAHGHDLIVVGYRGHLMATCCSGRRPTASPTTRTAR
jgi:nucleotide-binding universal stress UspA family protein